MAATLKQIEGMLRNGSNRRGPCFGAPDINPVDSEYEGLSEEEIKEREEAVRALMEDFKW